MKKEFLVYEYVWNRYEAGLICVGSVKANNRKNAKKEAAKFNSGTYWVWEEINDDLSDNGRGVKAPRAYRNKIIG